MGRCRPARGPTVGGRPRAGLSCSPCSLVTDDGNCSCFHDTWRDVEATTQTAGQAHLSKGWRSGLMVWCTSGMDFIGPESPPLSPVLGGGTQQKVL